MSHVNLPAPPKLARHALYSWNVGEFGKIRPRKWGFPTKARTPQPPPRVHPMSAFKDFFNFLSFLFFFSCFASTFGAFVLLKGVDVLWAGVLQTHQFSLCHVSWWVLASKPAWFHSCKHIHHASSKWITYLPFPSSGSVPEKKLHPYKQWLHFQCPRKDLSWEHYWTKQVWYSKKKNWDEWVYKMRLEKFQKSM